MMGICQQLLAAALLNEVAVKMPCEYSFAKVLRPCRHSRQALSTCQQIEPMLHAACFGCHW